MASKGQTSSSVQLIETPKATQIPLASHGRAKSRSVQQQRGYASEGVKDNDILDLPSSDWQLIGFITFFATFLRLFRIYQPASVVFDEVHFGGFATKYIKGKFFMDVHPPLAKLLITLAGWLAGFNGDFDFKDIGKDYTEPNVPYVAMRMLPAICGILLVPTIFLTLKAMGCKTLTAALGAGLVTFENGLLTQSRLILLDSPLILFTGLTALSWTSFNNQHELGPSFAFTPTWWFWLASTGVCLGATISVKWVGLFTIAWVGSLTLVQLWVLLGDTKTVTPRLFSRHLTARMGCLIVVPLVLYMAMFYVHFLCLVNPGDGDGFMSSEFQSTLNSKAMKDVVADVAFGSRVTIRHHNTQGGYLHSHNHMYQTGSKQQQITLYPHKDDNNVWVMENQTVPELDPKPSGVNLPRAWDGLEPQFVKNGDIIRLYHATTHRRLHSHDHKPPVTEADWQKEVTAYGYEGFEGDANDFFRIEIIKSLSDGVKAKQHVRTLQTKFKLVHVMSGCVLFSHKVKLPNWGFEQQEVTCANGATLPNSVWYVESNEHPKLGEGAEKVNYRKPKFLAKFWELQKVMWFTNAGLVDSHAWDSRPSSWPMLLRGINFWGKDKRQIYLTGNPVIWWSSTASILVYVVFKAFAVLRWQRGFKDYSHVTLKRFDYEVGTSVLGWAFHYFPFYLMARQLFLHHYFPALYFAILATCQIFDFVFTRFQTLGLAKRPVVGRSAAFIILALSIFAFTLYAPLAYGNTWTQGECNKVKLLQTWDWDCKNFPISYDEYDRLPTTVSSGVSASTQASLPAVASPVNDDVVFNKPGADAVPVAPPPQAPEKPQDQIMVDIPQPAVVGKEEPKEQPDGQSGLSPPEQASDPKENIEVQNSHETSAQILDAQDNTVHEHSEAASEASAIDHPVAPPHPDVEGANPETQAEVKSSATVSPAKVEVAESEEIKEKSAIEEEKKARPAASDSKETSVAQ